ncbi:BrnT family toxin [Patescibacteria group bacterium]
MKVYTKLTVFEWDSGNAQKSWERHKVRVQEAEEIFENVPNLIFPDNKHSEKEKRHGIFGITNEGRPLSGVFTMRGKKVRVITIRDMSKKEKIFYKNYLKEVDIHE